MATTKIIEIILDGTQGVPGPPAIDNFGPSSSRPTSSATGGRYFDTSLGYPIWWNGSTWVNALGTVV